MGVALGARLGRRHVVPLPGPAERATDQHDGVLPPPRRMRIVVRAEAVLNRGAHSGIRARHLAELLGLEQRPADRAQQHRRMRSQAARASTSGLESLVQNRVREEQGQLRLVRVQSCATSARSDRVIVIV